MIQTIVIILLALILLVLLYFLLICPSDATPDYYEKFANRAYAHRGLHDAERPENTIPAFAAAAEAGYGIELDVHLTADDQLVVFHDDTLKRVCGVAGRTDDKTLAELKAQAGIKMPAGPGTAGMRTVRFRVRRAKSASRN